MTVGSVVFATDQGLGYLAKSFYDHGIIHKVVIVRHSSRETHWDWYKAEDRIQEEGLFDCDAVFFFETPFDWKLIPRLRERGIKTILMPMYECTTTPLPYSPDLILAPSALDLQYYPVGEGITVPVEVPFRLRKKARTFVHNAGNLGLGGRNGTKTVIEAMKYVKAPLKLILRSQEPISGIADKRILLEVGQKPFGALWKDGDVFVFPEKFNGLSLPLQEAYASGMAVVAGDRFPINTWLPRDLLIPVHHYTKERIACEFDCAHYDPKELAKKMDELYGQDITKYSLMGKAWAEQNSWDIWKPKYEARIAELLR